MYEFWPNVLWKERTKHIVYLLDDSRLQDTPRSDTVTTQVSSHFLCHLILVPRSASSQKAFQFEEQNEVTAIVTEVSVQAYAGEHSKYEGDAYVFCSLLGTWPDVQRYCSIKGRPNEEGVCRIAVTTVFFTLLAHCVDSIFVNDIRTGSFLN
jgi:hypothetical protein